MTVDVSEVVISEGGLQSLILEGQVNRIEIQLDGVNAAANKLDAAIRSLQAERDRLNSQRADLIRTRNEYLSQIARLAEKRQL